LRLEVSSLAKLALVNGVDDDLVPDSKAKAGVIDEERRSIPAGEVLAAVGRQV
jgi:hypothetical protein